MQHFVLDCSVAITWAFEDEQNTYADKVLDGLKCAIINVPRIWFLEIDNVLLMNEKRLRITHQRSIIFRQSLKNFSIIKDSSEDDFYALAREFKLTTYDASYLELALRKKIPLATLDKALRHAAKQCKLDLYLE